MLLLGAVAAAAAEGLGMTNCLGKMIWRSLALN